LAAVFLRAWRRTQALGQKSTYAGRSSDEYECSLDYTRHFAVTELLRPLAEGIALFTEFDLLPRDSPVTTTPTLIAGMMFGGWTDKNLLKDKTVAELAYINLHIA